MVDVDILNTGGDIPRIDVLLLRPGYEMVLGETLNWVNYQKRRIKYLGEDGDGFEDGWEKCDIDYGTQGEVDDSLLAFPHFFFEFLQFFSGFGGNIKESKLLLNFSGCLLFSHLQSFAQKPHSPLPAPYYRSPLLPSLRYSPYLVSPAVEYPKTHPYSQKLHQNSLQLLQSPENLL